ncbi:MAG: hypothetical protein P4M11_03455 [Candidatus Pacebacteria bacterium]|nr:hypothetical protein [Candidatus Paceibacterota bacterium]
MVNVTHSSSQPTAAAASLSSSSAMPAFDPSSSAAHRHDAPSERHYHESGTAVNIWTDSNARAVACRQEQEEHHAAELLRQDLSQKHRENAESSFPLLLRPALVNILVLHSNFYLVPSYEICDAAAAKQRVSDVGMMVLWRKEY